MDKQPFYRHGDKALFKTRDITNHEWGEYSDILNYEGKEATILALDCATHIGELDFEYYTIQFNDGEIFDAVSGYHLEPIFRVRDIWDDYDMPEEFYKLFDGWEWDKVCKSCHSYVARGPRGALCFSFDDTWVLITTLGKEEGYSSHINLEDYSDDELMEIMQTMSDKSYL